MKGGWIALDKPEGISSAFATRMLGRAFGQKAGHAGTLDPFATGVLPIAIGGHATALIQFLTHTEKAYRFTLAFGQETDTGDSTGTVIREEHFIPDRSAIDSLLPRFIGSLTQTPPIYSAIRVGGERAYMRARRGERVEMPTRSVHISTLSLEDLHGSHARFSVTCSSGTYVRTLGIDLAKALGTCAHVCTLRRTRVGPFSEDHVRGLDFWKKISHDCSGGMFAPDFVLGNVPRCEVSIDETQDLWCGRCVSRIKGLESEIVACYYGSELVALAQRSEEGLRPVRCFLGKVAESQRMEMKKTGSPVNADGSIEACH